MACKIWKYIGLKIECPNCHKIFEPKSNKRKSKFCSLKCVFDYRRKISKSLQIRKQEILKKANGKCQKCGFKGKLHVHHRNKAEYYPKGHSPINGEQNNPENLIALCIFCHRKEHSKGVRRFTEIGKCIACGKEFKYYPKSNRGKYCSRKCAYSNSNLKLIPIECTCIYCGLKFMGLKKSKFCCRNHKSRWHYAKNRKK